MIKRLELTAENYKKLKEVFSGGFTHANHNYIYHTEFMPFPYIAKVASYDFNSSYPAVMLLEKYPMEPFHEVSLMKQEDVFKYIDTHACIMDIMFYDLYPKLDQDHPLGHSKCLNHGVDTVGCVLDNGRIVTAMQARTVITELDLKVINEFYNYSRIQCKSIRVARKQYLPKPIIESILKLYGDKTTLKGIESEIVRYNIAKYMLNSVYGSMVMDPVRDEWIYELDTYLNKSGAFNKDDLILKAMSRYNADERRFLYYAWGVWVTAYARYNLFDGIINCGNDYIYADTDSVKLINLDKHLDYFESYNNQIVEKIHKAAAFYKLDPERYMPKDSKGKKRIIGVWDFEGIYDGFKTLGAKRYMVWQKDVNDHHRKLEQSKQGVVVESGPFQGYWSLTVAGTNKYLSMKYILEQSFINETTPWDTFTFDLVIDKEHSKRLDTHYGDDGIEGLVMDYLGNVYNISEKSYVHLEPVTYSFTAADDFIDYLSHGAKLEFVS